MYHQLSTGSHNFSLYKPEKDAEQVNFFTTFETQFIFLSRFCIFLGSTGGHHQKPKWKTGRLNIAARRRLGLLCGSLHRPCGAVHRDVDCQVRGCAAAVSWGYEWSFPTWQWQNRWDDFRWQVNFCWRFLLFFFWWPEWLGFQCLIGCHFYGPLCHTHRGVSFFRGCLGLRLG